MEIYVVASVSGCPGRQGIARGTFRRSGGFCDETLVSNLRGARRFRSSVCGRRRQRGGDHTFAGTATGFLGLDPFTDESFTVTLVGDTDNVTFAGEFFNIATSAAFTIGSSSGTLTGSFNEVILNTDPAAPRVAFGQFTGFDFVAEALQDSSFASYNLKTAFPLTNGAPEFITQVFETSVGSLEFDSASFASFQATGGVPETSTWAMMALGFAGMGLLAYRKRGTLVAA